MTQTTSERIEAMLGVHYDWTGRVIEAGVDTAARKIAAEIDALRDEMAVILRERNDAHLALAEARAEVAKLKEQNRVLATTSLRDVIKSVHPSGRARGQ